MTDSRTMTPLALSILIHACVSAAPHPNRGAPAVEETILELIVLGAIALAPGANCITATSMGHAWLKALCAVSPPRRAWVARDGTVVAIEEAA